MDNLTPEQRRRSADARRGQKRTAEQRARMSAAMKARRAASSAWDGQKGASRSPEVRARISDSLVLAYKEGRAKASGCYKNKWRVYDGPAGRINMRSESELLFALKLDESGIAWEYEPRRFDLGWATYMPDFYLPSLDTWVEIKAWLTDEAAKKIDSFVRLGHRLVVVTYTEVREAGLPSGLKEVAV